MKLYDFGIGSLYGAVIGSLITGCLVDAGLSATDVYVGICVALMGVLLIGGLTGCYIVDAGTHTHAGVARKP